MIPSLCAKPRFRPCFPGLSVSLILIALAGGCLSPAAGQETDRSFGDPRHWLNDGPELRLPIRERPLIWYDGIDAPRLPAASRSGWTPRLSFVLESRDRTEAAGGSDTVATLVPGLSVVHRTRRWALDADLTFNLSRNFGQEQLSDEDQNLLADAQVGYALTPRDTLWAFAGYTRLSDIDTVLEGGLLPESTVIGTRSLSTSWQRSLTASRSFELEYANSYQDINPPGQPDITLNRLSAVYAAFPVPMARVETVLSIDNAEFEGLGRDNTGAAFARYTRELDDRLALSGELGLLRTTADGGRSYPKIGGSVAQTFRYTRLALELERSVEPVPGLSDLNLIDRLAASAHIRLAPGTQVQFQAERLLLDQLNPTGSDIQTSTLELSLSHALSRNMWLWGRVRDSRGSSGGQRERDTRLYFGLSRSFD